MRLFSCLAVFLFSFCILSCSSTSEGDSAVTEEVASGSLAEKNTEAAAPVEAKPDINCNAPPIPVMCCQAMTPTCNECKEKSRQSMELWRKTCAPPVKGAGCGAPPVATCCKGSGPECETCREEAQTNITAWRKSCGTNPAINCSEKPSVGECCTTGEPSCEACKRRISRLLTEFAGQCGK